MKKELITVKGIPIEAKGGARVGGIYVPDLDMDRYGGKTLEVTGYLDHSIPKNYGKKSALQYQGVVGEFLRIKSVRIVDK